MDRKQILSLRFQQVRLLKALRDNPHGLTRARMQKLANINGGLAEHLGPQVAEDLEAATRSGKPTLLGLGLAKTSINSLDGDDEVYVITQAGRKALDLLWSDLSWPFGH